VAGVGVVDGAVLTAAVWCPRALHRRPGRCADQEWEDIEAPILGRLCGTGLRCLSGSAAKRKRRQDNAGTAGGLDATAAPIPGILPRSIRSLVARFTMIRATSSQARLGRAEGAR
jgi:hypothetical protein